jgi:hypothetical protein
VNTRSPGFVTHENVFDRVLALRRFALDAVFFGLCRSTLVTLSHSRQGRGNVANAQIYTCFFWIHTRWPCTIPSPMIVVLPLLVLLLALPSLVALVRRDFRLVTDRR